MVTVPAEYPTVSDIEILTSNSLLPITTSLRGPSSAAYPPATASNALVLPAVNMVCVPVPLVCLIRTAPAEVVAVVVSVSSVSSASEIVIHAVTAPPSV